MEMKRGGLRRCPVGGYNEVVPLGVVRDVVAASRHPAFVGAWWPWESLNCARTRESVCGTAVVLFAPTAAQRSVDVHRTSHHVLCQAIVERFGGTE